MPQAGMRRAAVGSGDPSPPGRAGLRLSAVVLTPALGRSHTPLPLVCSAGLAKSSLSSKCSYSNNRSVFISPLVSKFQLQYLHSIYLNFIGVFS